jgi:hypothetical protein
MFRLRIVAMKKSMKVSVTSGPARGDQLWDTRARKSAGNTRTFSLGHQFHMGPLLYHIKEDYVLQWGRDQYKAKLRF